MSYVLDALRRAESERQRGSVPNLHAQNHTAHEQRRAAPAEAAWPRVVAVVAVLLAGAAAAWWWSTPVSAPPPRPLPVVKAAPAPAVPAPAALRPVPVPVPVPTPVPPQASRPQASPVPVATPDRVPRLQDLPEPLRRQVPALVFGGATDSPEPSARMLIINGQIWREGDEPAPGLKLERIALRGALFRYREQRFEVTF